MLPRFVRFVAALALLPSAALSAQQVAASTALKPLTTEAMNGWKSMRGSALSNDGTWFAYTVAPAEGDDSKTPAPPTRPSQRSDSTPSIKPADKQKLDALTDRFLVLEEQTAPDVPVTKPPHW